MEFREIFGEANWIAPADKNICPIIRKSFEAFNITEATIDMIGFASFVFYINGTRGSDDYFLPLATDYEYRGSPTDEETAHRCYVSHYDITHLIHNGRNTLAVMLGDGWYTGKTGIYKEVPYGEKKLCFKITLKTKENTFYIYSDTDAVCKESYVKECDLNLGEVHDYLDFCVDSLGVEFDDGDWEHTVTAIAPDTLYLYTDCPPDRVVETLTPTVIGEKDGAVIYDAGKNLTGFPTLLVDGYSGDVEITFSEALSEDNDLNIRNMHGQRMLYKMHGERLVLEPLFTWFGFRYFKIRGDARCVSVKRINCDVKVSSDFECDDEVLNWLYRAYILTQLSNMHQGVPSDCPHIERRGYLGDGHLTCTSAMKSLDAKKFYEKWLGDISDSQDRISGHVQYTAPYTKSGGGVGGFSHGFIKIPYQYYLHYGDDTPLRSMYGQFMEYLRYLEDHSVSELVVSDKEGEWCLGEWCVYMEKSGDMLTSSDAMPGGTFIPPAYVNTVYYVKSLELMIKIADIVGRDEDIPKFCEMIERKKAVIKAAFYNPNNSTFIGNLQGGSAFALDIGLGDEKTKEAFIKYYEKYPYFDTGIFGTEIVGRLLCEYGRADILRKMIGATEPQGYGRWREKGATTLWEYWHSPRSMSHPMFGSTVSLLYEYVLGIKQSQGAKGYSRVNISPALNTGLKRAKGYITAPEGRIYVSYYIEDGELTLSASAPRAIEATVTVCGKNYPITDGEITVKERIDTASAC